MIIRCLLTVSVYWMNEDNIVWWYHCAVGSSIM